jgi:hypothetical protein
MEAEKLLSYAIKTSRMRLTSQGDGSWPDRRFSLLIHRATENTSTLAVILALPADEPAIQSAPWLSRI